MVLETVLFRGHHVPTLVLSDFDLPLPGGGGGAGVDVDVDLIALQYNARLEKPCIGQMEALVT